MAHRSNSLTGVEWSGWPIEDAKSSGKDIRRRYAGFVYVIQFTDGWIKVGSSASVRRRMNDHAKDAALRGARIERVFVSSPHDGWRTNETALVEHCNRSASAVHGREYFRGLSFRKAVQKLEGLPQELRTVEEIEAMEQAANDGFTELCVAFGRVGALVPQRQEPDADLAALLAMHRRIGRLEAESDRAQGQVAIAQRKIAAYDMWFDPKDSIDLDTFAATVGIESGERLAEIFGEIGIFDRSIHAIKGIPKNLPEFEWLHCFKIFISRIPTGGFVDVAWILPEGQLEIVEELRNHGLIDF